MSDEKGHCNFFTHTILGIAAQLAVPEQLATTKLTKFAGHIFQEVRHLWLKHTVLTLNLDKYMLETNQLVFTENFCSSIHLLPIRGAQANPS